MVLENGSRLEDYSWSDEDGPSIETGFVRRVEVIRGPASVLYGTDAVGGVVNVISEPLPFATDRTSSFMRTGFTLSGASNNLELGGAARAEGARGSFGWRVAATGRYGANLHTPAGELDNTGFSALNGDFSDPSCAPVIDLERCSGKINSKAAQIVKKLTGTLDHTSAIVAPLIVIIVPDKIDDARPVFAFDGVQKILGMTRDLPLRLPEPN